MSWTGPVKTTEINPLSYLANTEDEAESLLSYDAEGSSYEEDIQDISSPTTTVEASASPEANKTTNTELAAPHQEETALYRSDIATSSALSSPFEFHIAQYTVPQETTSPSSQALPFAEHQENQRVAESTAALIEELVIDLGVDEEVSNAELHAQELAYQQDLFEASQKQKKSRGQRRAGRDNIGVDIYTVKMYKEPKRIRTKLIDETYSTTQSEKHGAGPKERVAGDQDILHSHKSAIKRIIPTIQPVPKAALSVASHRIESKTPRETDCGVAAIKQMITGRQNLGSIAADSIARAIFGEKEAAKLASKYNISFEFCSDGKSLGTIENQSTSVEVASQTIADEVPMPDAIEFAEIGSQAIGPILIGAGVQHEDDEESEEGYVERMRPPTLVVPIDDAPKQRHPAAFGQAHARVLDFLLVIRPNNFTCHVCQSASRVHRDEADLAISSDKSSNADAERVDELDAIQSAIVTLESSSFKYSEVDGGQMVDDVLGDDAGRALDLQPGSDEEQAIDALQTLCQGKVGNATQGMQDGLAIENCALSPDTSGAPKGGVGSKSESKGAHEENDGVEAAFENEDTSSTSVGRNYETIKTSQDPTRTKRKKGMGRDEIKRLRALAMQHEMPRSSVRTRDKIINYCESSRSRAEMKRIKEEPIEPELLHPAPPMPSSPYTYFPTEERKAKRKAAELISSSSTGCLYGNDKAGIQHPKKRGRNTT